MSEIGALLATILFALLGSSMFNLWIEMIIASAKMAKPGNLHTPSGVLFLWKLFLLPMSIMMFLLAANQINLHLL